MKENHYIRGIGCREKENLKDIFCCYLNANQVELEVQEPMIKDRKITSSLKHTVLIECQKAFRNLRRL